MTICKKHDPIPCRGAFINGKFTDTAYKCKKCGIVFNADLKEIRIVKKNTTEVCN